MPSYIINIYSQFPKGNCSIIQRIEPRKKQELNISGTIFGCTFIEQENGIHIKLYLEDDEWWSEKLFFHSHWLKDLKKVIDQAVKELNQYENKRSHN